MTKRPETKHPAAAEESSVKAVVSIRVPPRTYDWLRAEAAKHGGSLSETACRIFFDVENWFGMPKYQADLLAADRKKLEMDWRDYLTYVMTRRFESVQANGPGFDFKRPNDDSDK